MAHPKQQVSFAADANAGAPKGRVAAPDASAPAAAAPAAAAPAAASTTSDSHTSTGSCDVGLLFRGLLQALKTAWCDLPAVYKNFYCSCPAQCGGKEDRGELMVKAYALHVWVVVIAHTLLIISCAAYGFLLARALVVAVISLCITLLCAFWALAAAKYQGQSGCCDRKVSLLILFVVECIRIILTLVVSVDYLAIASHHGAGGYIVAMLVYLFDVTVLIAFAGYTLQTFLFEAKATDQNGGLLAARRNQEAAAGATPYTLYTQV